MDNEVKMPIPDGDLRRQRGPKLEELVDREEQIDQFDMVLRRIQQERPQATTLFEWYGGPGIGKTQLVRLLIEQCQSNDCAWACVDFAQAKADKLIEVFSADPTRLIEQIAGELIRPNLLEEEELFEHIQAYREQEHPKEAVRAYFEMSRDERLYNRPVWLDNLQKVVTSFIGLVNDLGQREGSQSVRPVAIFFDETESADVELTDWIEDWIISSLVHVKHCIVVWTARRPWRWKLPEIRRRIYSEQLLVFPEDNSKQQVEKGSSHPDLAMEFFGRVHEITHGHPAANAVAIKQINRWEKASPSLPDFSTELLKQIFDGFIMNYAFEGLKADEKTASQLLSLVRLFDTVMLRDVLKACAGEQFKNWSQEDFGDLLLRLKKSQLLVWNKGYALDPDLRYMLYNYFLNNERPLFIKVHRTALEVYQDWLNRPVDNRSLFVIEELYHLVSLQLANEPVNLMSEFSKRLEQYLEWFPDEQGRRNTLERLQGTLKHDKELERLTDGLSSSKMVSQVQVFLSSNYKNRQPLPSVS